ncbi:metallopeptidase family protein [Specibacter cremeus]|uniref:metallopeptidase family protein n=1 Tax=Specibacter cremeus TaxID=1629051 RepID=UPI000F766B0E|nr:metallopeptidase family protein [Specibacter cremeus]
MQSQEPRFTVEFEGPGDGPRRGFTRRRRDRHGRGLRGNIMPPAVPGARTRSEAFDDLVVDSAERLTELWEAALADVEFLVEEIPGNIEELLATGERAPLGAHRGAEAGAKACITVYRHPVEALVDTPAQLRELVHEVVIEEVAGLLNMDPDTVDPLFRRFHGRS